MEINLHNHPLEDAKEAICYALEGCIAERDSSLIIIHGHKHGTAIRAYIRSDQLLKDVSKIGITISSKNFKDDGKSILYPVITKQKTSEKALTQGRVKTKDYFCHKCNEVMVQVTGLSWVKCPKCGKSQKR